MKRWIKIPLIIVSSFFFLLILLWIGIAIYVNLNKKILLKNITAQLNENINGTLTVEDLDLTLIRGLPGISVSLRNVTLRDTAWPRHKHDLLKAENIYVSVNAYSIIKGAPKISDINIDEALIYLFVDSSGYSNTSIFKKKTDTTKKKSNPKFNHLTFTNVDFIFENQTKFKMFRYDINEIVGEINYNDSGWVCKTEINTLIKDFTFNTTNGSFLKNKRLNARLSLGYNTTKQELTVPPQILKLDDDEIEFEARFIFIKKPAQYSITVKADKIKYKNVLSFLSPNISKKLNVIDLKNPVSLIGYVDGRMKFRDTPLVRVSWVIKNNVLITPGGDITDCNFKGSFINSVNPTAGHNDKNSLISLLDFRGKYSAIPFKADSVTIHNLIYPILTGRFNSSFQLNKLNDIINNQTFTFNNGIANLDLIYKGGLRGDDPTPSYLKGYVKIQNIGFLYRPRNLQFTNSNVTLLFTGSDLLVRNTKLQSKSSILHVDGSVLNFLNLYYTAPEKIVLNWNIKSPLIDLNEFQSLLAKRKKAQRVAIRKAGGRSLLKASNQLDEVLDKSNVRMKLNVTKLIYRKFEANNITADMTMTQTAIILKNVDIHNSDGNVKLNANMDQRGTVNDVAVNADINNVNVQKFFAAFENFGQDAVTDNNLRGSLSAKVNVTTKISDAGKMVPESMNGTVAFNLKNGALVNFEPLEKIGKFIFKKRNLSNITFNDIQNTLELNGNMIKINPMHIESSALTFNVEGVYGLKKGTNILIDVPLRNPKKDRLILNDSLREVRSMKGIVLHLNAVEGEDGKVKFKLLGRKRNREKAKEEEK